MAFANYAYSKEKFRENSRHLESINRTYELLEIGNVCKRFIEISHEI